MACGKQAYDSRLGYHTEASISACASTAGRAEGPLWAGEKPGAIVPHAGICAGGAGNCLPTARLAEIKFFKNEQNQTFP
jgi:hypothetical protein